MFLKEGKRGADINRIIILELAPFFKNLGGLFSVALSLKIIKICEK